MTDNKNRDIRLAMVARGICTCGRSFMIFQPELRQMAEDLREALQEHTDIFMADRPEAFCSQSVARLSLYQWLRCWILTEIL